MLSNRLHGHFSPRLIAQLTSSAFGLNDLDLPVQDRMLISDGYMNGLHMVFVSYAVLIAVHLCAVVCIKDFGLSQSHGTESKDQQTNQQAVQNGDES